MVLSAECLLRSTGRGLETCLHLAVAQMLQTRPAEQWEGRWAWGVHLILTERGGKGVLLRNQEEMKPDGRTQRKEPGRERWE